MKAKELTIEEKAKAYDRALANAKEQAIDGYLDAIAVIDIFPELAESEDEDDEKIRKSIIEFVKQNKSFHYLLGVSKEDAVAWLEKQGNIDSHVKLSTFTFDDILALQCCMKIATANEYKELYVQLKSLHDRVYDAYWLEKQGEQKPAEWSKEDERNFDIIYGIIYNSCIAEDASRLNAWLKAIKDRVQPQPKQEWNEEDINMIDWLIHCCEKEHEELCNDKYGHQDIVSDLKRDCRKKWNWLESLKNRVAPQKQWNPSDEQLNSLYDVLNPCDGLNRDVLESLYNDLKKLKK